MSINNFQTFPIKNDIFRARTSRRFSPMNRSNPQKRIDEYNSEEQETRTHQRKFQNMVDNSHRVLYKISTVFPFVFFPDDLSIEINQVNIQRRHFFLTADIHSLPISNILDVIVQGSPFFATLMIIDNSFVENVIDIKYLHKNQAERARRIIQGLITLHREGVDITKIDDDQLTHRIESLGQAQAIEKN